MLNHEREGDGVNYQCPSCSYDGMGWKNGAEGWVDMTDESLGDICGSCCAEVRNTFQCERCKRCLSGRYHSAANSDETGRDVCLCGDCGRAVAKELEKQSG